jgi:hypothetical protein
MRTHDDEVDILVLSFLFYGISWPSALEKDRLPIDVVGVIREENERMFDRPLNADTHCLFHFVGICMLIGAR